MSWWGVLALCGAAYALKLAGLMIAARARAQAPAATDAGTGLEIVVPPVLAALIVVQTVDGGRTLVADPRLAAVAVAGVLVWRRAPLLVVVLAAGATAAVLRATT